jgi:lysozyme
MPENIVVDLSHHNANVDFARARQAGIVGVIHKATQGTRFVDPTYSAHKKGALAAGMLWGAYHFGVGGDGLEQAEHFLDTVQPADHHLLVLDFEANAQGPSMTLEEARAFVTHVKGATGRIPGLYAGHYLKELLGTSLDPVLGECWLWLSQYGPTPVVPRNWTTWTMWQYTDGAVGPQPHEVDGIGRCDRDKFQGTEADLRALWAGALQLPTRELEIDLTEVRERPSGVIEASWELENLQATQSRAPKASTRKPAARRASSTKRKSGKKHKTNKKRRT